jgi:hypothetical protein
MWARVGLRRNTSYGWRLQRNGLLSCHSEPRQESGGGGEWYARFGHRSNRPLPPHSSDSAQERQSVGRVGGGRRRGGLAAGNDVHGVAAPASKLLAPSTVIVVQQLTTIL